MNEQEYYLTRRQFLKRASVLGLTAVAGAGGLVTACTAPQVGTPTTEESQEPVRLTQFVWVGGGHSIVPRELKAEYERDHPWVTIELHEGTNAAMYPMMLAQKEVNPDDPLINFGYFNPTFTTMGVHDDMWVSLDPEKIPHMNDIFEAYHRPDNKGIGFRLSSAGIIYNSELVDEPPKSWMDLLDPKWKGKVMLWDYRPEYNGLWAVAHIHGGDIDKAFELYGQAAAAGQFHSLGTTNQMFKDAIARGEVLVAPFFISFAIQWGPKGEGGPFGYVVPEEGMIAFPSYCQIVKGSTERQIEVASDIINTFLSPETMSRYCNLTGSIATSKYAKLDKDLVLEPAFQPDAIGNAIQVPWDDLTAKEAEWKDRWDREVKARL